MNNVNIPASKVPLYVRSPFLEYQSIVPVGRGEMMISAAPKDKQTAIEATVKASVDYAASVSMI